MRGPVLVGVAVFAEEGAIARCGRGAHPHGDREGVAARGEVEVALIGREKRREFAREVGRAVSASEATVGRPGGRAVDREAGGDARQYSRVVVARGGAVPNARAGAFVERVVENKIEVVHEAADRADVERKLAGGVTGAVGDPHGERCARRCHGRALDASVGREGEAVRQGARGEGPCAGIDAAGGRERVVVGATDREDGDRRGGDGERRVDDDLRSGAGDLACRVGDGDGVGAGLGEGDRGNLKDRAVGADEGGVTSPLVGKRAGAADRHVESEGVADGEGLRVRGSDDRRCNRSGGSGCGERDALVVSIIE